MLLAIGLTALVLSILACPFIVALRVAFTKKGA